MMLILYKMGGGGGMRIFENDNLAIFAGNSH